jgi:hypothetical protein
MVDFDNFQHSAHRIETLPVYRVDEERDDFASFLAGGPIPVYDDDDWLESVHSWSQHGREISRIRVVDEKLSDYEKWEFQCYHQNAAAGELIRVLPRKRYLSLTAPTLRGDYWILDNITVWKMIYGEDGAFIDRKMIGDNPQAAEFVRLYDSLIKASPGDYRLVTKQINHAEVEVSFD